MAMGRPRMGMGCEEQNAATAVVLGSIGQRRKRAAPRASSCLREPQRIQMTDQGNSAHTALHLGQIRRTLFCYL